MREVTTKLFSFSELSEDAQEKAIQAERESRWSFGFSFASEWIDSLNKFREAMPFVGRDSYRREYPDLALDSGYGDDAEFIETASGVRLWKYLRRELDPDLFKQECKLTGVCSDESILDPLRKFMERPSIGVTFEDLIRECGEAWSIGYERDEGYEFSDENIRESLENSEDEIYTESGEVF